MSCDHDGSCICFDGTNDRIQDAIDATILAEREACAKLAWGEFAGSKRTGSERETGARIAKAIEARSDFAKVRPAPKFSPSTKLGHITNEVGDCVSWCGACRIERPGVPAKTVYQDLHQIKSGCLGGCANEGEHQGYTRNQDRATISHENLESSGYATCGTCGSEQAPVCIGCVHLDDALGAVISALELALVNDIRPRSATRPVVLASIASLRGTIDLLNGLKT